MASILKVDALQGITSAGDITVTSEGGAATQSLQQGLAKAWVNFDQSDNGVDGSLNASSVGDNGVGDITLNFTNSFSGDTFAPAGFAGFASSYGQTLHVSGPANVAIGSWKTSSLLRSHASYANGTKNSDVEDFNLICNGDLA